MAVDSRDKRMSMIGFGQAAVRLFKNPLSATNLAAARSMLLYLYYGIGLGQPPQASPHIFTLRAEGRIARSFRAHGNSVYTLLANRFD